MYLGELLTLATALIWAATGLVWAEGGRQKLGILQLFTVMTTTAALFSAVVLIFTERNQFPDISNIGAILVAGGGIICVAAAVINAETMKAYPKHTSAIWTVFQLCMVIPFLWSVVWWHKMPAVGQWIGFGCIVAALFFLAQGSSGYTNNAGGRWFLSALVTFVANGVSQALVQEASFRGWSEAPFAKAAVISAPISFLLWIACLLAVRRVPDIREWRLGVFGGLVSVTGSGTMFKAFDFLEVGGRQYLFFPTAVGGCIVILAAFQFITGRESMNLRKIGGMLVGLAGVILLGIK